MEQPSPLPDLWQAIMKDPPDIRVRVNDLDVYAATIIGIDKERDLAVLRICCGPFSVLPFGDFDNALAGAEIITMGYSLGIPSPATTARGIVSSVRYEDDSDRWIVQADDPIDPGNSGGPMLTLSGEVIGINTYRYSIISGADLGFAVSQRTFARPSFRS